MRSSGVSDQAVVGFERLLLDLWRRRPLRDPIAQMLEREGLTPPQLHVIVWLGHDSALTMGELARRVCITEKAITGVIDRLERTGRVRRQRSPDDRRVIRVHLTRRGATIFRGLQRHGRERIRRFLGALVLGDRRDLIRILTRLREGAVGGAKVVALHSSARVRP